MRRLFIELAVATGLTIAAVLAFMTAAHAGDIMIVDAFARASPTPNAKAGAVYLTIRNTGGAPDRLTGVASDAAETAMLHMNVEENGVVSMQHLDALDIAAQSTVSLDPQKTHVMLVGLKAPLRKGEHVSLTLTFDKAGEIKIHVPVGDVAATKPQ